MRAAVFSGHTKRMRNSILTGGLAALCLSMAALSPLSAAPLAQVSGGRLSGVEKGAVDAFLGIPFAAPPTGENRWRAPQPPASWSGVRSAAAFAPSCWQALTPGGFGPWTHEYVISGPVSEDCLYLNVWKPAAGGTKRPVFVWIYGGGFGSGSGSVPLYDGSALAARGIVVVTFNYRVGVLGFLAHPLLSAEARRAGAPPGNYGLQDQVAALRWVHANISAFGGDPDAVTIAGQSAGAMSVHLLIGSPLAKGLFRGAIAESGLLSTLSLPALATAEHSGETFAADVHADSLPALRALAPDKLAATGPAPPRFGPITDTVLVPDAAHATLNDTPLIVGMNTDDPGSFGPSPAVSAAAVARMLSDTYGAQAADVAREYPADTAPQQAEALRDIARDRGLAALYAFSRNRLATSHQPLYVYLFNHTEPGAQSGRYRAFHSAELPYVFDNLNAAPERGFTAQDRELAREVSAYWIGFVRTGVPASDGLPMWPALTLEAPRIMQLDVPLQVRPILSAPKLQATQAYLAAGGVPRLF